MSYILNIHSSITSCILPVIPSLNSFLVLCQLFLCNLKGISFKISKSLKSINAADCNIIEIQRHAISFKL